MLEILFFICVRSRQRTAVYYCVFLRLSWEKIIDYFVKSADGFSNDISKIGSYLLSRLLLLFLFPKCIGDDVRVGIEMALGVGVVECHGEDWA